MRDAAAVRSDTMRPPDGADLIIREASLSRSGGLPLHYGRVVRRSVTEEIFRLQPPGDPISLVITFPEQLIGNRVWRNGRAFERPATRPNSFALFDHREDWVVQIPNAIDSFHVWLPRAAFHNYEESGSADIIDRLSMDLSEDVRDEVMLHLASSLIPSLRAPEQTGALFRDYVFEAIRLHVAHTYAGVSGPQNHRAGLSPWQIKRAKHRILDDLSDDCGLAELADLCGVSVGHFCRGFKAATGAPPHRWLLEQRVTAVKHFLEHSDKPIRDIAQDCGFVDQSHLTRVFSRYAGASPAAWRRNRRPRWSGS